MKKKIWKKSLTMPNKNGKGGPFGGFQHPFCRKTAKKIEGGTLWGFFFGKKVSQCRKKLKGETRENRKNFFSSVR